MKIEILELIIGVFLFLLSNFLAFVYHYNRFYVIFLLGMFLILKNIYKMINKKEFLDLNNLIRLYIVYLCFGIIFDLIFGIWITKLWDYPSYSFINYIMLYFIIYPFGGFVMLYSFSLLEIIFIKKEIRRESTQKYSLVVPILLIIISIIGLLFFISLTHYGEFFILLFTSIYLLGSISYFSYRIRGYNFFGLFKIKPIKYALLFLIVIYIQGILHELPNVFAHEWIYHDWPLQNATFFGIPILVLIIGWIYLLVMSFAVYEFIINRKRNI